MLLLLLSPAWTGCVGEKRTPTPTAPTTPTAPPPRPTALSVSGNLTLTSIGETSQLTVTASFIDNTTKDVTADGRWQTNDATVVTVSPGGLLTVVGFGVSFVSFTFQSPSGSLGITKTVTATPPGTVVISGRVSEPGAGGLASTLVVDTLSGRSATTDSSGVFSLAELPRLPYFKVEKDGYEPIEVSATGSTVDLRIQRVIRLIAGETVKPAALAPQDLSYTVGEQPLLTLPSHSRGRSSTGDASRARDLWRETQAVRGRAGGDGGTDRTDRRRGHQRAARGGRIWDWQCRPVMVLIGRPSRSRPQCARALCPSSPGGTRLS